DLVVLERPADEEHARPPHQRPHREEVEVVAPAVWLAGRSFSHKRYCRVRRSRFDRCEGRNTTGWSRPSSAMRRTSSEWYRIRPYPCRCGAWMMLAMMSIP